jgi:hypothetical protein
LRSGLAPIILARANAGAIGEGDPLPIWFQLPPRVLVFHTPGVMPEARIAFLPRLLFLAFFVEASNRKPGPISRCLASLGVEPGGKGIVFGKR